MKQPLKHRARFGLVSAAVLTGILFLLACGGLVKLHISERAFAPEAEKWAQPYGNMQRQHRVKGDVPPPYGVVWQRRYRSVVTDHPLAIDSVLVLTTQSGMMAYFHLPEGDLMGDGHLIPGMSHGPTIRENIVYVSGNLGDYTLAAFDMSNVQVLWKTRFSHLNSSPLLWDDRVIVAGDSGKVLCVQAQDGKEVWRYSTGETVFGNLAADSNSLYLADVRGRVVCLDVRSGQPRWQVQVKENVYAGPTIGEGLLFLGTTAGIFYGIDTRNGEIRWQFRTRGSVYGHAAYGDGVVYFGCDDHYVYALRSHDGSELWKFRTGSIVNTTPLVGDQFLYFGGWDRFFYVLDRFTGDLIYRQEFPRPFKSSPIIYQGKIYFHLANYKLFCLENRPGQAGGGNK